MKLIPSTSLKISDVPSNDAAWNGIQKFALTFDGYEWAGSFERCADLANSTQQSYDTSPEHHLPELTLDELRACLFFEQRRFRHFGWQPSGQEFLYIRGLLTIIRQKLEENL